MHIDPNTGGVFFQLLAAAAALVLLFAGQIRSRLARVRRRITRPQDEVRIRHHWGD